jgi:hypothetical protein
MPEHYCNFVKSAWPKKARLMRAVSYQRQREVQAAIACFNVNSEHAF